MHFYQRSILLLAIGLFPSMALAYTPQTIGLGGGGRAGIGKESLVSNPAGVALLRENTATASYTMSRVKEGSGKGRVQTASVFDGTSDFGRGGVGYFREMRRRSLRGGLRDANVTEFRAVFARPVFGMLLGGGRINYVTVRENGRDEKWFSGDIGFLYPIFSDLSVGLSGENLADKALGRPRAIGGGVRYDLTGPLQIFADLERTIGQVRNGAMSWSLATEIRVVEEFNVRGSLFQDAVQATRGWAVGATWMTPRTSFEYALRQTKSVPHEVDHVFGIGVVF